MIVKMKKLSLVAMRSDVDALCRDLVWQSCVEAEKCQAPESDAIVSRMDCGDRINELEDSAFKLAEAIKLLSPMRADKKKLFKPRKEMSVGQFCAQDTGKCVSAAKRALDAAAEREALKTEKNRLQSYITSLSVWTDYDVPLGLDGTRTTSVATGTLPSSCDTDRLKTLIGENCKAAQVDIVNRGESVVYISAVCHKSCEKQLSAILADAGFIKSAFPVGTGIAEEEMLTTQKQWKDNCEKAAELSAELAKLALLCPDMETAYDAIKTQLSQEKIKQKLLATGYTVILSGWVPENKTEKLQKVLSKYVCFCEFSDPEEGENVPVALKNNGFASPFEFVVGMYSYPKYGSFDPTFWTGIFFFVIFGMMFADAGYGLLLVLLGALAIKFMKPKGGAKNLFTLFVYCGIACIVCGVLFGGYFGDLPAKLAQNLFGSHKLDNLAILCNPIDEPVTFLVYSIALGAAHIFCGMGIKMYMCFKRGDWQTAVFDIGSWYLIFLGGGLYALLSWKPALVILGAGLAMEILMKGRGKKNIFLRLFSGIAGLYDLISYASDLLSYSRIFALALAGTVIASVVNTFTTLVSNPLVTVILVIVMGTFGHIFNLALSALGAFVHTCRLQYIEFFGKFYEEGGRHFVPASPELKYTDILTEENN